MSVARLRSDSVNESALLHALEFKVVEFCSINFTSETTAPVVRLLLDQEKTRGKRRPWSRVCFYRCRGTFECVLEALVRGDYMQELRICNCEYFDSNSTFFESLSINRGIKNLEISTALSEPSQWADDIIRSLGISLNGNNVLEILTLSHVHGLHHESFSLLGRGIQTAKNLRSLNFSRNGWSDSQLASLLTELQDHPSLRDLYLEANHCGPRGLNSITTLIGSSTPLEILDLSRQPVDKEQPLSDFCALAQALRSCTTLKRLNLNNNNLDDHCIDDLAESVLLHSSIQQLELTGNSISDEGVEVLSQFLGQSCNLKKLFLQPNPFGERGGLALMSALEESNRELEFCSIPGKLTCGSRIYHLLQLNKGGSRLLQVNDVPLGLLPLALERAARLKFWAPGSRINEISQINVIHELLQGPAFLQRCR